MKNASEYGLPLTSDGHPDFEAATYDVFNRERSIGVRAGFHDGQTLAVQFGSGIRKLSEEQLARQVVELAQAAAVRGRHGMRQSIEYQAELEGRHLDPEIAALYPSSADANEAREAVLRLR